MRTLPCRNRTLTLDRPLVMGILNVTPDSFSDGGRFLDPGKAIAHAKQMVADGADLIRVHDTGECVRAVKVAEAVRKAA